MWILCTDEETIVNTEHITKIKITEVDYGGFELNAANDIDDVIACLGRYETYREVEKTFIALIKNIADNAIYFEMPKNFIK